MSGSSTRARSCPSCGALNASDFPKCIRCGVALSGLSSLRLPNASWLTRPYDGRSFMATKAIMGMNLLIFAGQVMATMARGLGFPIMEGGSTADAIHFGAIFTEPSLVAAEPWRLLSAAFVHFGALHIAMNLFALAQLSRMAEPIVGSARFAIAYVTCAIVSFATTAAVTVVSGEPSLTAGASGAVFGMMGLILGVLWARRDPQWKRFAVQAVIFSLVITFSMSGHGGVLVNHSAHLGGLACGVLFGIAYARPRASRSDVAVNLGAMAAIAACVLSLLLAHASPLWHAAEVRTSSVSEPSVAAPSDPS